MNITTWMEKNMKVQKNEFTLIELLVVIAIIAVLATMLFPVVGSMKEKSLQTKCTANLKNLGTALNVYSSDNENWFPSDGTTNTKTSGTDSIKLMRILRYAGVSATDGKLYVCPSSSAEISKNDDLKPGDDYTKFKDTQYSYVVFNGNNASDFTSSAMKSNSGIIADGYKGTAPTNAENTSTTTWNHDKNGRYVYSDGSVQGKTSTSWYKDIRGNDSDGKATCQYKSSNN